MSESNTTRVSKGVAWSFAGRVGVQLINVATTAVLARLLAPQDFGLVGMSMVYFGFISMFRELGLASAIVREERPTQGLLSSIFWMNVLLTGTVVAATLLAAPFAAAYFKEPLLTDLLRVQSIGLAFSSLGMVQGALLQREMKFRVMTMIDIGTALAGALISIGASIAGFGVWALVFSSILSSLLGAISLSIAISFRPMMRLAREDLKSVAGFSLNLTAFNTLNYFARNADSMMIGRHVGAVPLAHYRLAYNLMLYPVQNISQVLGRVLYPAFSMIQDDNARFRNAYIRTCSLIAAITSPLMVGLWMTSDLVVRVLYGEKWLEVAPILAVLAPVGFLQSLFTTVGQIYTVKGRADWLFRWGIGSSAVTVLACVIGLQWGALGVAIAYAASMIVLAYPCLAIPFRLIDLGVIDFLKPIAPLFASATVMAVAGLFARKLLESGGIGDARLLLAAVVAVSAICYVGMIAALKPPALGDLLEALDKTGIPVLQQLARRFPVSETNIAVGL
jgi:O-antigen/teichoic acid export membrane protein